ncbi:IQ calmodulin-binding motif domain containing protein [Klebsormidium nitens]|uniref:IQ calmodulin-binding motif domain containing protein n=1 Tax=Klebsormidium nitens TaxID=105231 RepID=A0A1Y1IMR2_KLENI|nr:IQ calmodulin-binding motif domain containing protein [Klebsormidium nitens]|eukprot:GAQ91422.1 IQ calmodulin-binding motif domain containing protein [Klebsormidium nitens]
MGMKKTLTRIFSKKAKDGSSADPAVGGTPVAGVAALRGDVAKANGSTVGYKSGEAKRVPLSGLDKLNVVLNPPKPDPQRALAGSKSRAASRDARAATKIQAAYRGHLVRRSVRTHKSLVKVQALVRGHIVRRQAAITLRCMNALVRVQARARANAVRKSATGREVQQRLEAGGFREPDGPEKKRTDGWVSSAAPISELEADYHRRQTGFIKRERARAYAASFQNWKTGPAPKTVTYIPNDPDHEGWGWGWLERWMVARPWRNRSFIDASDLSRKDWAPPRRVIRFNSEGGGPLSRRLSDGGAFPAKVVEREEPNLERDFGEQRQCKWCGRLSSRVKDTEAGPLCGVCQLNTATATRLNKDPYAQTGTKVPKQEPDFPTKVVDWEEPNLGKAASEQRQCKWCGRLSSRVKDTEAGPLCGVCQLNTATATRLNKDPYVAAGPKTDSPTAASSKTRSVPATLAIPRKAATPSPTAARAERRLSFPPSPKVAAASPGTPKSIMSPMGTPRFMQPTASSLPKFRTSTPSPRLKPSPSADRGTPKAVPTEASLATPPPATPHANGRLDSTPKVEPGSVGDGGAAGAHAEQALAAVSPHEGARDGADQVLSGEETRGAYSGESGATTGAGADTTGAGLEPSQGASNGMHHVQSSPAAWPSSKGAPLVAQ